MWVGVGRADTRDCGGVPDEGTRRLGDKEPGAGGEHRSPARRDKLTRMGADRGRVIRRLSDEWGGNRPVKNVAKVGISERGCGRLSLGRRQNRVES
jgi:hypothetical protein